MMKNLTNSRKNFGGWLALGLLATFLLAGCGSSSEEGGGTTEGGGTPYVLIAADDNGDLYLINPTNGAILLALDVWARDAQGNRVDPGPIGGMVYDPARSRILAVLGSGGPLGCVNCVYSINPATGEATLLNDLDPVVGVGDLARRASDGAVLASWVPQGESILWMNPADGAYVNDYLPSTSFLGGGMGMTFAADGKLYLSSTDISNNINLFEINPADPSQVTLLQALTPANFPTAAPPPLGPAGTSPLASATPAAISPMIAAAAIPQINSMVKGSDGTIHGILEVGSNSTLVTIDPAGLTYNYVATLPTHVDALGIVPVPATSLLLAADENGDIFSINPASGAITLVRDVWTHDSLGNPVDIGPVGGMVFDPATSRMLAIVDSGTCAGCVYTIDPATGQAILLNDVFLSNMGDVARNPSDGTIVYAEPFDGTRYGLIDPLLGIVTGDVHASNTGGGLAYGPDGILYTTSPQNLHSVGPYNITPALSFVETLVGTFTYLDFAVPPAGSEYINSMATAADGTIYGIMVDGVNTYLVAIDPVPLAPTVTWKATLPKLLDGLTILSPISLQGEPLVQFGSIGGHTFRVVEGIILQSGPDLPITPVGGPATLLFDEPISTLSTVPNQVHLQATGTVSDGGSITAFAFGSVSGPLVDGFATGIVRSAAAFNYQFQFLVGGTLTSETGLLNTPADANAAASLSVDFSNDGLGSISLGSVMWNTDMAPDVCSFDKAQVGIPQAGGTDQIGVRIKDSVLQNLIISDPVVDYNNC